MLAKLAETGAALFGGSTDNNTNAGGTSGSDAAFDFTGATGKQRTLNGNRYDPKAFEQGDFSGIANTTPEDVEAAKLQRDRLKETEKNQAAKNRHDTGSYRSAKNIAKNEQYHLQQRDSLGLEIRGAFIGTDRHSLENILPGLEDQNQALGLSQAKSSERIAGIQDRYAERRAKVAMLRR